VPGVVNRGEETRHQIDLYWDASDGLLEYRVFANAKWRKDKVELPDLMAMMGVWRDIGAHKAVMITNSDFSIGVKKQAKEKGIGLLIVRAVGDFSELPRRKVGVVLEQIAEMGKGREVFTHEVVHKGFWEGTKARRDEGTEGRSPEATCGRQGDKETGRQGEGNAGEDWMGGGWTTIGGEGGGGGGVWVPNKGMGRGQIRNKMMGGRGE
jgi:hypothetical protein